MLNWKNLTQTKLTTAWGSTLMSTFAVFSYSFVEYNEHVPQLNMEM